MNNTFSPSFRWFLRLWSIAIIAHLVGDPRPAQVWPDANPLGISALLLGVAAVGVLVRPTSKPLVGSSAVGVLVVAWIEAPFLSNHWLLVCLIAIALLAVLARPDPWVMFAPTGRWLLLAFYTWAAFNKLNSGFFDASVSCGPVYANEWLNGIGLPSIALGSGLALLVSVLTAATELSIPVLLFLKRSRRVGVWLGFGFHGLISLDFNQHFYDFTSVLLALFTLFLADASSTAIEEGIKAPLRLQILLAGFPMLLVVASVLPIGSGLLNAMAFVVWVPFLIWVTSRTLRVSRIAGPSPIALRLRHPALALIVILAFANGLTPYLELKTAFGWNMYANLVTVNGDSNHFIVRRSFPLTGVQGDLAVILDSDDPGLMAYENSGYAVPERQLLNYLASHPDASVRYEVGDRVSEGLGAELGQRLPILTEKLQMFRAVDLDEPARCQTTWLPAG